MKTTHMNNHFDQYLHARSFARTLKFCCKNFKIEPSVQIDAPCYPLKGPILMFSLKIFETLYFEHLQ